MSNPLGKAGEQVEYIDKPSGYFIIDGQEVGHTRQCPHCNKHFLSIKGSGTKRGFCTRCLGVTCGCAACDICVPFEEKMEIMEGKSIKKSAYSAQVERIVVIDPTTF
jgi:hypothetical protein